jgi:CHAT domain-containing protein/tetratricopeptide (TPR) repeat protein
MNEALELLENSLAYFTETSPNEYWASVVYFNIGRVHRDLGDRTRALNAFKHSLELRSPDCDPVGRAESLHEIATIGLEAGQVDQTLEYISEAEVLLDPFAGNYSTRAALLNLSGRAYSARDQFDIALARHDKAFTTYRSVGDRQGELDTRIDRALVNAELGKHEAAIADLRAAVEVAQEIDARLDRFQALTLLSEIYLAQRDTDSAQEFAAAAIEQSEDVRRRLVRPILLRDYFAVQRAAFDVLVEVHLERDDIEQAWRIADENRARRFRDVVRRAGLDLRSLTLEQRGRYQFLAQAIAARAETRTAFLSGGKTRSADLVLSELIPLLDEMDLLQEQARRSTIASEINVNLKSVQSQIRPEERIVEYFVGPNVAGFWSIDEDRIDFHPVPQGDRLEEDIDVILKSIRRQQPPSRSILKKLSRNLLGTSEFASTTKSHLIVVPDGPLHYLPFAVLPDPVSDDGDPLIARWDVTYLPSIGALIELRSRPSSDAEGIAIVADPVFQPDDPRVRRAQGSQEPMQVAFLDRDLTRGAERIGIADFPRLPRTLDEANAVQDAAGDRNVLTLHGTDANRDVVLAGALNHYKILHFATHGILDSEEPALSGLVLSGVKANGAPRSRFLRSQDIAGLNLAAQLVVLSGCETGLGRPVSGEGLVGLSRAFFYAGANQVVSTLWQVPDRATAELMRHFYSAYLQDGHSVPGALRRAQLEIRNKPEWRSPFYWAAFIVQGDWR